MSAATSPSSSVSLVLSSRAQRSRQPKLYVSASGEVIPPPSSGVIQVREGRFPQRAQALQPEVLSSLGRPLGLHPPQTDPRLLERHARWHEARRPRPANPLRFSQPTVPRFPAFPVPRHVREQIGAHLRMLRLQCDLTLSRTPQALRLPISPIMISAWERGAASPWLIYVDRLSQLAGYTLHEQFVAQLQAQFAPWLESEDTVRIAPDPKPSPPIPFLPMSFV